MGQILPEIWEGDDFGPIEVTVDQIVDLDGTVQGTKDVSAAVFTGVLEREGTTVALTVVPGPAADQFVVLADDPGLASGLWNVQVRASISGAEQTVYARTQPVQQSYI